MFTEGHGETLTHDIIELTLNPTAKENAHQNIHSDVAFKGRDLKSCY